MGKIGINDIKVSQYVEKIFEVNENKVRKFSELSEDCNPIHLDEQYAKNTMFKGRIAHGMLIASFISGVIGNDFPGEGTIYLKQDVKFLKPVRFGDQVKVHVEVKEIIKEKHRILLETSCYNQNSEKVIDGMALVKLAN